MGWQHDIHLRGQTAYDAPCQQGYHPACRAALQRLERQHEGRTQPRHAPARCQRCCCLHGENPGCHRAQDKSCEPGTCVRRAASTSRKLLQLTRINTQAVNSVKHSMNKEGEQTARSSVSIRPAPAPVALCSPVGRIVAISTLCPSVLPLQNVCSTAAAAALSPGLRACRAGRSSACRHYLPCSGGDVCDGEAER